MADAAEVEPGRVGEEDVGPQVDGLRRTLEAPPEPGERIKVHCGIDGDCAMRIEGDGMFEELPRFINVGRVYDDRHFELWMSDARIKKSYACQVAGGFKSVRSAVGL